MVMLLPLLIDRRPHKLMAKPMNTHYYINSNNDDYGNNTDHDCNLYHYHNDHKMIA